MANVERHVPVRESARAYAAKTMASAADALAMILPGSHSTARAHTVKVTDPTDSPAHVGGPRFPPVASITARNSRAALDEALVTLAATKQQWANLGVPQRVKLLRQLLRDMSLLGDCWIEEGIAAKGLAPGSFGEGEEWFIFAGLLRNIQQCYRSIVDIERYGRPRIPGGLDIHPDGRVIAKSFPSSITDALLFKGTTAEIWMRPGISAEDVLSGQARVYQEGGRAGAVALVLGAGNVSTIAPSDVISKLFVANQVVLLKMNPVNAYLGPLLERGFRVLIERGFLRIVYGDAAEGAYLCAHPLVDTVHMTGSDKTYEAVVFGSVDGSPRQDAAGTSQFGKPVTGELGGVNPVIIIPGPWTVAELRRQAIQLAGWQIIGTGFACLTPRVIIQYRRWERREALIAAVHEAFKKVPTRLAYYPGAHERHAEFLAAHPEALLVGDHDERRLPWTIMPDVDPSHTRELAFTRESFCNIYAETALDGTTAADYIRHVVEFVNTNLWGNLCATVIVHPKSLTEPGVRTALAEALIHLRYGTICINMYPGLAYSLMAAPWGAFPGNQPADIQSGVGWVNNLLMLEHAEKVVFRAPFTRIDPTLVTFRHVVSFGHQLARFTAKPSPWKLIRLMGTALRR